ncbi:ABC transporter substrate-binding protein [Schinkia azotoformans]|uniref:ABC transporter substrate-binding protein n=1 Tax=Schinkia azotoformans TaxID=1454 RepID=UPI002E1B0805|nr:ABC transporter substrate-binding protein [Schinkia azotoformans]
MKKYLSILIITALFGFILAGCNSAGTSSSEKSSSGASGSKAEIPIGLWATITGPDSNVNGMVVGIKDYLVWANETKDGVNGHHFKVELLDGKYDMNEEIKHFNRFVNVDKSIVIGAWSTGVTKALRDKINQEVKVPVISMTHTEDVIDPEKYPFIFTLGPTYESQHKIAMEFAKENGAKTFAFIHNDKEYGSASVENVIKEKYAESLGLEVVANVSYPITTSDVTAQLLQIKEKNPDYIYIQDSVNNVVTILRDAEKVGIPAEKFIGNFFGVSQIIIDTVGKGAEGFKSIQAFSSFDEDNATIAEIKEFQKTNKIQTEDQYFVKGWVIGKLIEEAVKKALEKNNGEIPETAEFRQLVQQELENISGFDVGGGLKEVNYADHKGSNIAKIVEIRDGKYVQLTDWIEPSK